MDKIAEEIEKMAEKMEKANQNPTDRLFAVIKSLGKDGLKARLATLSEEDKLVLKAALEEITLKKAVSFDKEINSVHHVQGKTIDTIIQEDKADDDVDETLMKPEAAHQDHQGTPTQGWAGQVIKAAQELTEEEVEFLANPFAGLVTELPDDFAKAEMGFEKLKGKLAGEKDVKNPAGVAAAIGRKKYGKAAFDKKASEGKKMKKSEEIVSEIKKSDALLGQFITKALDHSNDPEAVLAKCLEMGIEKAKVMGAMKEYAKDKKVMDKVKKAKMKSKLMKDEEGEDGQLKMPKDGMDAMKNNGMKKSGTASTEQKEEENPEAKKQDGDAPNLQVGGNNRSGAKKTPAPDVTDVGQASKDAQKDVDNMNVETMAKALDKDKSKEEAKEREEAPTDEEKVKPKQIKVMKKSVSWEGEDRLLKANTLGRNFNFSLEGFVQETIKKSETKPSDQIKKAEKLDINDLIEKSMDQNWDQLKHKTQMEENAKKQNGKLVKSFDDVNDLAAILGLSEEEAKKILG